MLSDFARRCCLFCAISALIVGIAQAGALSSGGVTIGTLDTSGPVAVTTVDQGGVNFWANWTLDAGQSKVDPSSLRWLQLSSFSRSVAGFPDRAFIDPRSGQPIGDTTGDAEPWYDITGSTKDGLSLTGGGLGAWMGDGPFAIWSLGPLTFTAETLVVSITNLAAKQAVILGGVEWGYSISSAGGNQVSVIGVGNLTNSQTLVDQFNTQLANDFPGWSLVYAAVPEPGSVTLALLGVAIGGVVIVVRQMKNRPRPAPVRIKGERRRS